MGKRLLCALFALFALCARGENAYPVYYEIFPYSFYDSNADGIGDLKGIEQKLDEIASLGVGGLWLTPISAAASYHKYDAVDFLRVDPDYGDLAALDSLLAACRARGMRVIADLVVNHTSSAHPWFESAARSVVIEPCGQSPCAREELCRAHNPYCAYYNFVRADAPPSGYTRLCEGWCYESVFWAGMPDLNLTNPEVRAELEKVMDFYLDRGVGGFRLDAALHYTSSREGNIEVLRWIANYVHGRDASSYLVAEVWADAGDMLPYYASGVDSLFNFPFATATGRTAKTLAYKGAANSALAYQNALLTWQNLLSAWPRAVDAPFGSNHDVGRVAGFVRRDEAKIKMYAALNLTMTGVAFVYYGEELGMPGSGTDENKRAPMAWTQNPSAPGMTQGPPGMTSQAHDFGAWDAQTSDAGSILSFYRALIALRKQYPAISRGEVRALFDAQDADLCAVSKTFAGETVYLYYNLAPDREIAVPAPENAYVAAHLGALRGGQSALLSNGQLACPPMSLTVLKTRP